MNWNECDISHAESPELEDKFRSRMTKNKDEKSYIKRVTYVKGLF